MTTRQLNAIAKAADKDVNQVVRHVRTDGTLYVYHVDSGSCPDVVHTVCLSMGAGRVATACSCPAGQHECDCWHVAAVMLYVGFLSPECLRNAA